MLLRDLISRNARRYPNKTALVFGDLRYSFEEYNQRVNRVANGLLATGLNRGDRIAILCDSCPEYAELYWAGAKSGIVLAPVNTRLSPRELAHIINDAEPELLFLGRNYLQVVDSIRPQLSYPKGFVAIGGKAEGMQNYEELLSPHPATEPDVELSEHDTFCIAYTSGTTGLPKGAVVTQRNFIAATLDGALIFPVRHGDTVLNLFPYFHVGGFLLISTAAYVGCTYVGLEKFDPTLLFATIEKERVTTAAIVTAMIISLPDHPDISRYDLSSLGMIIYSGAALPVELLRKGTKVFGSIFVGAYGQTEAVGSLAFLAKEDLVTEGPEEKLRRLASCGKEALNVEIRVVDEEGNDVPPNQIGEMIIKADSVMKGYWKLPQATAEVLRGGYLYTGDLATRDGDGYIYPIDRKKDMIVSGGERVYPREVEEVIYRHPAVVEAAVVGMPDEELGEAVKAFVALKQGETATAEDIIELCRPNLAKHAIPKSVELVPSLPRTPSGKVLKRVLREGMLA